MPVDGVPVDNLLTENNCDPFVLNQYLLHEYQDRLGVQTVPKKGRTGLSAASLSRYYRYPWPA